MFKTTRPGYCRFQTGMGVCAMGWTTEGVDYFALPADRKVIDDALEGRFPDRAETLRPRGALRELIGRIRKHLDGRVDPLTDVPVDYRGLSPFTIRVCRTLRRVKPGRVLGYGDLARKAGSPGAARAVGSVMARNRTPLLVPCHRVLPSSGGLGAFSSAGGPPLKARLLHVEGYVFSRAHQAGLDHLAAADRRMARIIREAGPYLPAFGKREDPYDVLVLSIIHQQLSMKAAATIAGRVRRLTPGDDFPAPARMLALPEETLRGAGLSFQKISYLKDLARRVDDGRLDLRALWKMGDEETIETLCAVRGIGLWTAQMVLIFNLGRLDIWPVDDLGLRNAVGRFEKLAEAPTAREMDALGEKWRPYRSMAAWYLWRTVDGGGV